MNGEIPSVPITTLAGVSSLVDLLPEIPLPSPLPQTLGNKSLLFHPRVAEEAQRLLYNTDDNLVPQLVHCISQTSSKHIELKVQYNELGIDHTQTHTPALLSSILLRKPDVFKGKYEQVASWTSHHHHESAEQPYPTTQTLLNNSSQQISQSQSQKYLNLNYNLNVSPSTNSSLNSNLHLNTSPNLIPSSSSSSSSQLIIQNHLASQVPQSTHSSHSFNSHQQQQDLSSLSQSLGFIESLPTSETSNLNSSSNSSLYPSQPSSHPPPQLPFTHNFTNTQQQQQIHQVQQQQVHHHQVQQLMHQQHQNQQQPQQMPRTTKSQGEWVGEMQVAPPSQLPSKPKDTLSNSMNQNLTNPLIKPLSVSLPRLPLNLPPPPPPSTNLNLTLNSTLNTLNMISNPDSNLKPPLTLSQTHSEFHSVLGETKAHPMDNLDPKNFMTTPSSSSSDVGKKEGKARRTGIPSHKEEDEVVVPKAKIRRVECMLVPVLEKLSNNVLSSKKSGPEGTAYHRFLRMMSNMLESCEWAEFESGGLDEDGVVPSELLLSKHDLTELCSEAAKLKALGAMEAIPVDKVVELLKLLEMNIREGAKVTPLADNDDNEDESKLWVELTMESIQRGVTASLTALHILTSQNMPKKAYIEDVIDRIVFFTKFQLQNTVFPTFDPVYRIDSKGKDNFSSGKRKRAHAREVREKNMISFYNKIHEVVGLLAELLNVQILTDTTVLHLSTLGVSPFFVENVSELQLSSLKLVTAIFAQYEKHRRLLLDDILASIARLPSSKRGLRTFKLSGSDECIQMLTALVLQLIQSVSSLPHSFGTKGGGGGQRRRSEDGLLHSSSSSSTKNTPADRDALICSKYEMSVCTAANFLSVFLNKCGTKSEEVDYRVLFENFVQDLLSTVNRPEWPAAELLLSLLGTILVKNIGNKGLEVGMRVTSLEYLGVAAARLRKDAVGARVKMEAIDRLVDDIREEEESYSNIPKKEWEEGSVESEEEKTEFLQRLLLDYLAAHGSEDGALLHARHFLISYWWKNAQIDITKAVQSPSTPNTSTTTPTSSPQKIITATGATKKRKRKNESSEDESDDESDDDDEVRGGRGSEKESETNSRIISLVEKRKTFLLSKIRPFVDPIANRKTEVIQSYVDYSTAQLITRYLSSKRPFSASFDFFIKRILTVSSEQTVAIRTKSLRCLTMVVEADPNVLARIDIQCWVKNSFLDQSTAVREAAVDLVGKYILSCHELIEKYYEMLSLRILDTGVSVRKRVIKILRDICVECPSFSKIPEICVKMIRRVNDEDGIRKLVMEVFTNMWFTPVREEPLDSDSLLRKVSHITDVVASCEKFALDFFEQLLLSLFKPKDDKDEGREKGVNIEPPKSVVTASGQIVNCLVEHVLRIEESSTMDQTQTQRFIACVATLFLFAKIRPQLLVNHAITLEAYLSMRCQNPTEVAAVANISNILELVVPLLVNPSDSFLSQLEEDCVKLLFRTEKSVIDSCLACLGAVVNKITKNFILVRDCFRKFQSVLSNHTSIARVSPHDPRLPKNRPSLKRAVYTIGLFLRHFDFSRPEVYGDFNPNIVDVVFSDLLYLLQEPVQQVESFSLQAIGNLCIRHYDYMLGTELKTIYHSLLTSSKEIQLRTQVLSNLQLYLVEEELRMVRQDQEWSRTGRGHDEDIKEMGDVTSGMASTIVQLYLKQILEAFLHHDVSVRLASVRVIQLVLQQGLVHPIQIVPYLICMSTDEEAGVSSAADKQLGEMEKKHPQFLQSQVLNGIKLSLSLQRILAPPPHSLANESQSSQHLGANESPPIVRGFRTRPKEIPSARNGFLYSLLRTTKPQRRAIALSLLKQFDEQNKNGLGDLLYYADNLAYFPYQVVDEPLFMIHHIDIVISVTGSNLLQAFKEALLPAKPLEPKKEEEEEEEEEDFRVDEKTGQIIVSGRKRSVVDGPSSSSSNNVIGGGGGGGGVTDILEDDDDEDVEGLLRRVPEEESCAIKDFVTGSQGCLLLLLLKQHLKDMYALTEAKISSYSPSDATKTFERPVNRKNCAQFEPKCTLANLKSPPMGNTLESRRGMVEQYLHFKQLMLRIDPEEGEEDGVEKVQTKIKIDQNLFTLNNSKNSNENLNASSSSSHSAPQQSSHHSHSHHSSHSTPPSISHHQNSSQHHSNNSHYGPHTQQTPPTPIAKVEPMVRVPKLTIVPLKFPGGAGGEMKIKHKVKEHGSHHHHHKHKKSKHKKKKKYAVSDDEDSDNPDSDPDFRI